MSTAIRRPGVMPAVLAAVAATATDGAYVSLILSQNATGPNPGIVPFLIVYIAAIAAAAVLAVALILREQTPAAWALLVSATTASAALGVLAIFSIGLALLITAALMGTAAFRLEHTAPRPTRWLAALTGSAIAIGTLIAGFAIWGF
jgi:hypothetical protein